MLLLSSLLVWLFDSLTCFVILNSFGGAESSPITTHTIPLIALAFLAIAVGNLTKVVFPITPGAIGPYEGALTVVFSLGGIDPNIGLAAAILDHVVKNAVTLVFGSFYLSHFGLSWHQLVEQD